MKECRISECSRPPGDNERVGLHAHVEGIILEGNVRENYSESQLDRVVVIRAELTVMNELLNLRTSNSGSRIRIKWIKRSIYRSNKHSCVGIRQVRCRPRAAGSNWRC